ncbi:MAG: ATP-binding cassette domain-containing protein [Treponemataceae bacterium]
MGNDSIRQDPQIRFNDCFIGAARAPALATISWSLHPGELWIVTGPNGGGKSAFAAALTGALPAEANEGGECRNEFKGKAILVSFEEAASLIARERANDDSDFVEGGVDQGTTARAYIAEMLSGESAAEVETNPAVVSCGVLPFLDRGLKRLSTGEIRRTLLARALAAKPGLLVLDEPFEGLDAASRVILADILENITATRAEETGDAAGPRLVLVADRWEHIPTAANRVVELRDRAISFCGTRDEYERILGERRKQEAKTADSTRRALEADLDAAETESTHFSTLKSNNGDSDAASDPLIEFTAVTVEWSERKVLDRVDWKVMRGEHWLIRGPNGSGKTTILELITGDNPQVFRNDVRLFGLKRGSGETIWELKERMGIVSYRLHLEYRYMDDSSLEEVLISGLHDSIGLYREAGDAERLLARRWLDLAGFSGRAEERFGRLSFGEQRALLVARGAIKGPELLILDEPCHGLDEAHRDRVLSILEAVAARGRTTLLYVTHDPKEMLSCVRNVLELRPERDPMWATLTR